MIESAKLIKQLKRIVGPEHVLSSRIDRETYAYDSSTYYHLPDAVVFPKTAAEISQIVQLANKSGTAVVPRGAGTCISGGAVPSCGGIVLATARMDTILQVDLPNERIIVETGVTNQAVQQAVQAQGLMYAPDPASSRVATIGGNIGENAGGMRCVKYGVTRDHVLGLEVVLPDGEIILTGCLEERPGPIDLTQLFVGSEGLLGIVTKAMLKLVPIPQAITTLLAAFPAIETAGAAVSDLIGSGIVPLAMEIMDDLTVKAVDEYINYGFPPACTVMLLELAGCTEELSELGETVNNILQRNSALSIKTANDESERSVLWSARQSMNGALGRIRPAQVVLDPTIPIDKLSQTFKSIKEIAKAHGLIIAQQAHAGDGNIHPSLMFDPGNPEEVGKLEQVTEEIFQVALAAGGSLSGEHGIGLEKRNFLKQQFAKQDLAFMRTIKQTLDPNLILNPDKVF